jgi:hypothetical protein
MKIVKIPEVGDVGYAVAGGLGESVSINNDVGGTEFLPKGRYRVKIVHSFEDYEVGQRLHGHLLDEKDRAVAKKVGTTKYAPKGKKYAPRKVYFHANQFVQEVR